MLIGYPSQYLYDVFTACVTTLHACEKLTVPAFTYCGEGIFLVSTRFYACDRHVLAFSTFNAVTMELLDAGYHFRAPQTQSYLAYLGKMNNPGPLQISLSLWTQ